MTTQTYEQTSPTRRIVVGVDGSESSRQALRWAQSMADRGNGSVEAVMAWQIMPSYAWAGAYWGAMPGEPDPASMAEKVLHQVVDEVFGADRPAGLELTVTEGSPAGVLVERSKNAAMVVVGSRGHGGFAGLLLGSVSEAVAEHAACPVLVVHGDSAPF
jgi:nucleotide-binding universal stress UspA family protein